MDGSAIDLFKSDRTPARAAWLRGLFAIVIIFLYCGATSSHAHAPLSVLSWPSGLALAARALVARPLLSEAFEPFPSVIGFNAFDESWYEPGSIQLTWLLFIVVALMLVQQAAIVRYILLRPE
eukprot:3922495-Prymnesium_polylepis.1